VKVLVGYRAALAVAMIGCGIIIFARIVAYGLRVETLPGIVLGAAMVALGLHRLSLLARRRRGNTP
jgi:hypothetical protein